MSGLCQTFVFRIANAIFIFVLTFPWLYLIKLQLIIQSEFSKNLNKIENYIKYGEVGRNSLSVSLVGRAHQFVLQYQMVNPWKYTYTLFRLSKLYLRFQKCVCMYTYLHTYIYQWLIKEVVIKKRTRTNIWQNLEGGKERGNYVITVSK